MIERFECLGHDAVVGSHHEDDDVGRLSAAGTLAVAALGFLPWALNLLRNYETFAISMRWRLTYSVNVIPVDCLKILQK